MLRSMTELIPDDVEYDDPDWSPPSDAAVANIEQVSRMLGALRRLHAEVADYDRLHQAEIERLDLQRRTVLGAPLNRIDFLESTITRFGVRAFADFGKTKFGTPNGIIKSSATKPAIDVDDAAAAEWVAFFQTAAQPPLVEYRPKVFLDTARDLLGWLEEQKEIVRILTVDGDDAYVEFAPGDFPQRLLEPRETGRWYEPATGELVPGFTWRTTGTDGVGRNFRIVLA